MSNEVILFSFSDNTDEWIYYISRIDNIYYLKMGGECLPFVKLYHNYDNIFNESKSIVCITNKLIDIICQKLTRRKHSPFYLYISVNSMYECVINTMKEFTNFEICESDFTDSRFDVETNKKLLISLR